MKYRQCSPGDAFSIPLKPSGYGAVIAARVSKPSGKFGFQAVIWYAIRFIGKTRDVSIKNAAIDSVVAVSHMDGNAHIEANGWKFIGKIADFSREEWPVFPVIERNGIGLWMDTDGLEMQEFDASIIQKEDRVFFSQLAGDCSSGYLNDIVVSEIERPHSTRHGIRFTHEHLKAYRKYEALIRDDLERRRERDRVLRAVSSGSKKLNGRIELWKLMDAGVVDGTGEGKLNKPKVTKRKFLNAIRKNLVVASRAEAKAFGRSMGAALVDARSWKLWSAAYIMNGGCSEDGFLYFRLWLLAQGRRVYSNALVNPESLASAPLRFGKPGDFEFEELLEVVDDAIGEFDFSVHELCDEIDASPKGVAPTFTSESLRRLYPKLCAKFA